MKAWLELLALLVLAALPRAALLAMPRHDLFGDRLGERVGIGLGEEIVRGNIAQELLDGPVLPLLDYEANMLFGGSVVVGVLAAPLFAAFGPRLVVLKLVPVGFHLCATALLFAILRRHSSRRAARYAALLYGLGPPAYTIGTTVAWGTHLASNALALGSLWLFLRVRDDERARGHALLGVALGFSLWFGIQCALWIALIAAADLLRRGPRARRCAALLFGFVVGCVPRIIYCVRHDVTEVTLYGRPIGTRIDTRGVLDRVAYVATDFLPNTLGLGALGADRALAALLVAVMLYGLGHALARLRSASIPLPLGLAWAYCALFVFVLAVTDFADPERRRYAMLLAPWVGIAVAEGLARIPGRRAGALLCAALAVALAGTTLVRHCDVERFGKDWPAPAADRTALARWAVRRYAADERALQRLVDGLAERRSAAEQDVMYREMAGHLVTLQRMAARDADPRVDDYRAARRWFRTHAPEAWRGLFRRQDTGGR